ncbi:MAG: hypothetical protein II336_18180 [Loktanella sp.]|nr:hypothetical protein [Loktanella sp.]
MIGRLKRWLAWLAAGAAAVWGAWALGKREGTQKARTDNQIQEHNEYVETRKRMEAADPGSDVDKWLRDRAKRGGDL